MKKIIKNNSKIILSFFIGMLCSSVTVYAAYSYLATDISFTPSDENWEVTNVEEALNDLYQNGGSSIEPILVGTGNLARTSSTTTTVVPGTLNDEEILSLENNIFTVKKEGYYIINSVYGGNITDSNGDRGWNIYMRIYVNGTQEMSDGQSWARFKTNLIIKKLNVGDTIYADSYGNGGSAPKRVEYKIIYVG